MLIFLFLKILKTHVYYFLCNINFLIKCSKIYCNIRLRRFSMQNWGYIVCFTKFTYYLFASLILCFCFFNILRINIFVLHVIKEEISAYINCKTKHVFDLLVFAEY